VKTLREYMDMEYFRKVQMDVIKEWVKSVVGDNSD
ncbi:MAG: polymerase, beta domain protein region, partial [Thermoanaerobacter sp.]|nr:polymerase, beta domain protein region [Thermoanaerobacter sp.]